MSHSVLVAGASPGLGLECPTIKRSNYLYSNDISTYINIYIYVFIFPTEASRLRRPSMKSSNYGQRVKKTEEKDKDISDDVSVISTGSTTASASTRQSHIPGRHI